MANNVKYVIDDGKNKFAAYDAESVDSLLNEKVNNDAFNSAVEELEGEIEQKANTEYVNEEIARIETIIEDLPEPMIFKGTLGTGGTIQELPTASASNEGFTYKVITAGTYAGQSARVGDVFISNGSEWVLVPAGDDFNDTWRAIKVNGTEVLNNAISSGAVNFNEGDQLTITFDAETKTLNFNVVNTYTKQEVDDIIYNVLPDGTANGAVANFNTSLRLPIKSMQTDVNAVQESGTPTPTLPLPISGWNKITLVNCGNKYKPNIKPFSEWERARSDYYISRFSVPNTIITVNLIDKDTTVDLLGISFGYVDSNWDTTTPLTTTKYRWFIQGGTVQSGKRNVSAGDASIILTGLIFYPATEATYNKLMARYDYEFVFTETTEIEHYNTEEIDLGSTYYGGNLAQDKAGHRKLTINMEKDTMLSSYLLGLSSSYIGYVATVPAMNNHPCIWVRNWKYPPNAKGFTSGGIKAICNAFDISMNNSSIISTQFRVYFDVNGMNITNVSDFISAVVTMEQNGKNLEICYEKENPVVVDLPNGVPIITINGTNNIFADSGDTTVIFKQSVNDAINAALNAANSNRMLGKINMSKGNESEENEKTKEEIKEDLNEESNEK